MEQLTFDIVPTRLAVQAMRDNGYKNAAYAVAELMDNSIQAGATRVELLCCNERQVITVNEVSRITNIAVLDNGSGMSAEVLRMALQFGNGTRLDDREGMGRFGMGLPNASISQARRVDVWTWTEDPDEALHSYIDIDEINDGSMREVPDPAQQAIPKLWRRAGTTFDGSGTLVVWSRIDRCMWKTARSIINHSEFVIGRMYRKFLHQDRTTIRMVEFDIEDVGNLRTSWAVANDPGYLMVPSSTPEPYDSKPMFERYGDYWDVPISVEDLQGNVHTVHIRFSHAQKETRQGHNPGSRPYGQHARKNVGVSVVRAERELEMSQSWVIQYDPTERWWGVEVEFPPALDEIFGVANNKQTARHFADLGKMDVDELLDGRTMAELKDEMRADGDAFWALLEVAHVINKNLSNIRGVLKRQTKTTEKRKRYDVDPSGAEAQATEVTEKRKKDGYHGLSDDEEELPETDRIRAIEQQLVDMHLDPDEAHGLAVAAVHNNLKYLFAEAGLETPAFFSVRPKGGAVVVTLNENHPAHEHLLEVLESVGAEEDDSALRERLENALRGLKLLLLAWARYEDEQPEGDRRDAAMNARGDWGRMARQFLKTDS